uniref:Prosaposin n=1 Tax=Scleropages formosus TaxID=113540 RepID=A0A8C9U6Q4_SCLFO
ITPNCAFCSSAVATPLLGTEQCAQGPPYWCQNVKTASVCNAVTHCLQNVWNKPQGNSVACDLCKEVLTVVGQLLKDNATQSEILSYLEKACQLLPDPNLSSQCKELVDSYYPVLIGIINGELNNPGAACAALGLCSSQQKVLAESQLLSNEIPQVDAPEGLSPFLLNVPQLLYPQESPEQETPKEVNGDVCESCVKFITDAQEQAKANSSFIDSLIAQIEKQCDLLGPGISDMCKQYVGTYGPLVIQQLMSMQPRDICCRAGFCSSAPMEVLVAAKLVPAKMFPALKMEEPTEVKPLALKPSKKMVRARESPQCVVCEFVMKELESLVENPKEEEAVVHAVEKVCSLLPSTLKSQCKDLIDAYGQAIIELLVQEADPKTICTVLGLCKGANRAFIPEMDKAQFEAGGFCEVCKMAVRYIDGFLEQNATEAEIEDAVKKVCNFLPDSYKEECDQLIEQYGPVMVQLLLQMMDPDFVCMKVGACPGVLKKLLGTEQCSWGPSFWCTNMDTASRCNAVEHCKRHVWN